MTATPGDTTEGGPGKAMTPDRYCQERAARSGSSFYYSFLFLEPGQRRAITAVYAFCREVDDVVDECRDPGVARLKLGWWRQELDRIYAGRPEHPVGRALLEPIATLGLPREHFLEIVAGMEMDLDRSRYESFPDLALYCHRAAGVVGLLAARVFGYEDPRTEDYALRLGTALQLTNILRDVGEDTRRGRLYLPLDELERFGVTPADLRGPRTTPPVRTLLQFQAERARRYYAEALAALPEADRDRQRSGLIMAAIYQATLDEIERDGFRVLEQRTSLTPLRKLWLAWQTAWREQRRQAGRRREKKS